MKKGSNFSIEDAENILEKLNVHELKKAGFNRGWDINFPGNIVVIYPPFHNLGKISEKEILDSWGERG